MTIWAEEFQIRKLIIVMIPVPMMNMEYLNFTIPAPLTNTPSLFDKSQF